MSASGWLGMVNLTTLFALLTISAGAATYFQWDRAGRAGLKERLPAYVDRARTAPAQLGSVLCPFDFGP